MRDLLVFALLFYALVAYAPQRNRTRNVKRLFWWRQ